VRTGSLTSSRSPEREQDGAVGRVTLQTIADRLGVSRMTVSNAFSRPDQLSSELRQRILAVAEALGYVGPDPAARALARGTTGAIGVLLTDELQYAFTDEVATRLLGAIVEELAPTGLALTLLTSGGSDDMIPARDVAMDGALVYSCHGESPARDWLLRRELPLVFVDQLPVAGITSINVDDRGGARAAAQHVVDLGHRRIDLLTLRIQTPPGAEGDEWAPGRGHPQQERIIGWREVLHDAGIEPTVAQARTNSEDDAVEAARTLLSVDDPPTAVLCFSDVVARGVIRAADELGRSVPENLSVVGFDDSLVARHGKPALTTVRQDVEEKGRLAAAALTAAIGHARTGTKGRIRHQVLPTELVVRDSTAPPPARG
jgi:DNA-binding LacI/PurR family transcriptional regulator